MSKTNEIVNSTISENIKKLGFGLMRLPMKDGNIDIETTKTMVDMYIKAGFTYFDTAYVYGQGASEMAVSQVLTSRYARDKFYLATKLALWDVSCREDMEKQFNIQLDRTKAGYFDFYLLHSLGADRYKHSMEVGAWEFVKEKKKQGLIKHIGFSFHDKADVLDTILSEHPEAEFVQLQINYKDWEDENVQSRLCYETARKYGKKIVIMEPVKGGMLASVAPEAADVFKAKNKDASAASWAIRFAASLDGVLTVLSGMSDIQQMADNTSYMENFVPLDEDELKCVYKVADILANIERVECTKCSYCTADCPSAIKIPELFSVYNNWLTYHNEEFAKRRYNRAIAEAGKACDCIGCGQCEDKCPQHIKIPKIMEKISELFDKN